MHRIGTGITLVAICASAITTLAVTGNTVLALSGLLILLLIALGIVAPRVPGLKRVPLRWIRHPLKPRFTFGDSPDLTVWLPGGEPQSVVLRVGVRNESWLRSSERV